VSNELIGFIVVGIVIATMLVTIYGAAIVLTENFWLGIILFFLLPPFFLFWAFIRGLIGKND
jgi:hypothetical protein